MNSQDSMERRDENRFEFGMNWSRFLNTLDENRIGQAEQSLREKLGVENLHGRRLLDVGSGSGLFSLAAKRLGAKVRSFDYDPKSVVCTNRLRCSYFADDPDWTVEEASVLDEQYMSSLGTFDIVYSWGVLHHTGQMRRALGNVASAVAAGGLLFVAIYNDQGAISRYWRVVKRLYNLGWLGRAVVIAVHAPYLLGVRWIVRALSGGRAIERGMSLWHDMIDWVGGYPFEVARPEDIFRFYRDRGFVLEDMTTCGGRLGCNEFVFRKLG